MLLWAETSAILLLPAGPDSSPWHSGFFPFIYLFFVLMEPRDFFLKALVLYGYPLGRQVMAKLNLLPQLLSTFVRVLSCAAYNFSITDHSSDNNSYNSCFLQTQSRQLHGTRQRLCLLHNPLAHRPC